MAREPEHIRRRRAALGSQLATFRQAEGRSQHWLAAQTHYHRSTISHLEAGHHGAPERFWRNADDLLNADGAVLTAFRALETAVCDHEARTCERLVAANRARAEEMRTSAGSDAVDQPQVVTDSGGSAGRSLINRSVVRPAAGRLDELLAHLREQWHALVKTDNLLGPSHALRGVHDHLRFLLDLLPQVRGGARRDVARLSAQYAESAAWLHEECGNPEAASKWTSRSMDCALQAEDPLMFCWALFRKSQQATASLDAAATIALAEAAHRHCPSLPSPMRAALAQQQAHGHALDGDARSSNRLLDEAQVLATSDGEGDARYGHGSFCTEGYVELQRGNCWLTLGEPKRAVGHYQAAIPQLPAVYQRDRGAALGQYARALVEMGELDEAASVAVDALGIARGAGSKRILNQVGNVAGRMEPHRELPSVGTLLTALAAGSER